MEDWIINVTEVDCLFQLQQFMDNLSFYTCVAGKCIYKLNINSSKTSVMFTGLNINKCLPDVVPLKEVQEYFNMLYLCG